MSHYDLVELTEDTLEMLNVISWIAIAVYAAGAALAFLWHALCVLWMLCSLLGTVIGVLLWLVVHAA